MYDLKVPTVQLDAEIHFVDGTVLDGTIYLPSLSAVQAGPMFPLEWINSPSLFFPFRTGAAGPTILVNKRQVLALGVATPQGDENEAWEPDRLVRHVVVEAGAGRFEGDVIIDMPEHQRRLADRLNLLEAFLPVQSGGRQYLVQRDCISRVTEVLER